MESEAKPSCWTSIQQVPFDGWFRLRGEWIASRIDGIGTMSVSQGGRLVQIPAVEMRGRVWSLEELAKSFEWTLDGESFQPCDLSSQVVKRDVVASLDRLSDLLSQVLASRPAAVAKRK